MKYDKALATIEAEEREELIRQNKYKPETKSETESHVDREKTALEILISQAKDKAASNNTKSSSINSQSPIDLAKVALDNRDRIKKSTLNILEMLEEVVSDFNDSYHESKVKAMNDVLSKEDYVESLKNNIFKTLGVVESVDEASNSQTPIVDADKQTNSSKSSSSNNENKADHTV